MILSVDDDEARSSPDGSEYEPTQSDEEVETSDGDEGTRNNVNRGRKQLQKQKRIAASEGEPAASKAEEIQRETIIVQPHVNDGQRPLAMNLSASAVACSSSMGLTRDETQVIAYDLSLQKNSSANNELRSEVNLATVKPEPEKIINECPTSSSFVKESISHNGIKIIPCEVRLERIDQRQANAVRIVSSVSLSTVKDREKIQSEVVTQPSASKRGRGRPKDTSLERTKKLYYSHLEKAAFATTKEEKRRHRRNAQQLVYFQAIRGKRLSVKLMLDRELKHYEKLKQRTALLKAHMQSLQCTLHNLKTCANLSSQNAPEK